MQIAKVIVGIISGIAGYFVVVWLDRSGSEGKAFIYAWVFATMFIYLGFAWLFGWM